MYVLLELERPADFRDCIPYGLERLAIGHFMPNIEHTRVIDGVPHLYDFSRGFDVSPVPCFRADLLPDTPKQLFGLS